MPYSLTYLFTGQTCSNSWKTKGENYTSCARFCAKCNGFKCWRRKWWISCLQTLAKKRVCSAEIYPRKGGKGMYEQCCQQYMSFPTFYSCDDTELLRFLTFYALVMCVCVHKHLANLEC